MRNNFRVLPNVFFAFFLSLTVSFHQILQRRGLARRFTAWLIWFALALAFSARGANHVWAAACSSVAGTVNWNAPASWTGCGGTTPQAADTVTIINNSNVTMDVSPTIAGLTFTGGANANSLNLNGNLLTVNGTVTMNQPTASVTSSFSVNNGTATVSGLITLTGNNTTSARVSRILITSGQLNANGGITFGGTNGANATKVIDMSGGAGRLNLSGALTFTVVGTLTAGTAGSVFNYVDTANQTIRFFAAGAYYNLHINNTGGTGATLSAAVTASNVTGNIVVESGLFRNGGFAIAGNASRTFMVQDGAAFDMTASNFPTTFGTFTFEPDSTVRYMQNASLTVTNQTYGNLELRSAGTRTYTLPDGDFDVLGDLTIGNGTNACTVAGNTNATVLTVGGNVTINASSVLRANPTNPMTVGGSWTRTGTFTNNSGTVIFNSAAAGNTLAGTMTGTTGRFYNLEFNGAGGEWTNTGALEVNNNFTITNGTFTAGNSITVTGNWTNDDAFNHNNQTVTFNATSGGKTLSGTLSGPTGEFFNVTFNGSGGGWSPSSSMIVTGTMTMTAGTLSGTNDVTVNGGVIGTAGLITLTGGVFEFRVSENANFGTTSGTGLWTFNDLLLSNSSGADQTIRTNAGGTGQFVINGTFTVGDAGDTHTTVLDVETNDRVINANSDAVITTRGSMLASSSQIFYIGGNFTNNGSFTSGTGSVTFDSTATGNLLSGNLSGSNALYTAVFNGSGGEWTVNSSLDLGGLLTVTAGTLQGTGDITVAGNTTGNGTNGFITMTGGTFTLRGTATQTFGTNAAGANNWTFYNLVFSNSGASPRIVSTNGTGTGRIVVTNLLTIGDPFDVATTTFNANSSDRIIQVDGDVLIESQGIFQSASAQILYIAGNYTNNGTFIHDSGTVMFNATAGGRTLNGTMSGSSPFYNLAFNGADGEWTNTASLAVAGALTVTLGTFTVNDALSVTGASNFNGGLSRINNTAGLTGTVTLNGGTVEVNGSAAMGGALTVTNGLLMGTGDISVVGAVTGNGTNGQINMTGGTFLHRVAANQSFGTNAAGANDWIFNNVTFSNASGTNRTITVNGTGSGRILINGNLIVGDGSDTNTTTLSDSTNDRALVINGDVTTIASLGILQGSDITPLTVGGNWSNYGTFTSNNGTVTFNSSIAGRTLLGTLGFGHLHFNGAGGSWTAGAAITVTRDLHVESGLLEDGGFQIAGNATYDFILGADGELALGSASTATSLPTLFTAPNTLFNAGSTVTYNAGVNQAISGTPVYGNLRLNAPSGTPTKTAAADVTVAGNVLIGANNTYSVGGSNFALTVGGTFDNQGTFAANAGTVTFNSTSAGQTIGGNLTGSSSFNHIVFDGTGGSWSNTSDMDVSGNLTVTNGTLDGSGNITVNGSVFGNGAGGQINLSGGTFEQRVGADQIFGADGSSALDWTFNNLTFSNSSAANRVITANAGGTGAVIVAGDFTLSDPSDGRTTIFDNQTNNRVFQIQGDVVINAKGTYQASASRELQVGGDWSNAGVFTHNGGTVTFLSNAAQTVDNQGKDFGFVVSSNTAAGGLSFSSGFSAAQLYLNTAELNSPATLYFANGQTYSIGRFDVNGTAGFPVVLRPSPADSEWFLNNTGGNAVSFVDVRYSNASGGARILNYPGGMDGGNNTNWVIDINAPAALQFTAATAASLTASWPASIPAGDSYTLQLATSSDFGGTVVSSETGNVFAANEEPLFPNTTYYARVRSVLSGLPSSWTQTISTATWANLPADGSPTWSSVQQTSLTLQWGDNSNPSGQTVYVAQISSGAFPNSFGSNQSSQTTGLSGSFSGLAINATYYAQVKAINHQGVGTAFYSLGSTVTLAALPDSAASTWTAVGYSSLTVTWIANGNPAIDTGYEVSLSSASDFSAVDMFVQTGTSTSSEFIDLDFGTTFYARVRAINAGGAYTGYVLLGSTKTLSPTTCNAVVTGDWSNGATWSGCSGLGGVPGVTDLITINSGVVVTLDQDATVAGLTFAPNGSSSALTDSGSRLLTITGPVVFNQPTVSSRDNSWNINAGSAIVTGLISFNGANTTTSRVSRIVITSGQLSAQGGLNFQGNTAATKQIVMSGGAGRLNMGGNLTFAGNSATLTAGAASVFNYNDPGAAQTVRYFASGGYHHLYFNNTSAGGVVLSADKTTAVGSGDILVQSGTFKNGGFSITGGAGDSFEVADGAVFEMSGASAFPGSYSTYAFGSLSTVRYLQSGSLTVTTQAYGNLDLMPAGTATQNLPAGAFTVAGNLGIGNGTDAATISANANATTLTVNGTVSIFAGAVLTANSATPLAVGGNWNNQGSFNASGGTVAFVGGTGQTAEHAGQSFAFIVSSNTSAGGLTFTSSFTATQFLLNTADLNSSATVYFASNSTATIGRFIAEGTPALPAVLGPGTPGTEWFLNVTGTHAVHDVQVSYSNASAGQRIWNHPGGSDGGNNTNWAIGLNAPAFLEFTAATPLSLTGAWPAPSPAGDSYTFQVSTDPVFNGTVIGPNTTGTSAATPATLVPNTTYYGRVNAIIYGSSSSWTVSSATVTPADLPASVSSTWTYVGYSSVTLTWFNNGNPLGETLYWVDLSTAADFSALDIFSSATTALDATFDGLDFNTVYYARVKAVNHAGEQTGTVSLGSTNTFSPTVCNAAVTGNWSSPGTWLNCTGPGGIPATTDAITINSGVTVTLNQSATVAGLTFAANGGNSALTHSGTNALTVNGNVTFNQPTTNNRNNSWNVNAGSATVTGTISFLGANTTTTRISRIVITTGQFNVLEGMIFQGNTAATKQIVMSGGAGTFNLKGNISFAGNSATLTAGTAGSVFNYNDGIDAQTVPMFAGGAYNHLYLNNTGAGATLSAAITAVNVTGDVRVQSGLFSNGGFAITGGAGDTFEVADGAVFKLTGTSSFPTGHTTLTLGSASTIRYSQTTDPLTIDNVSFGNLDLMPSASAIQNFPAGSFTVQGDLTMGDGTTVTTISADANNTDLAVNGDVTIASNAEFTAHATNPMIVGGNWTNNDTFDGNGGTLIFSSNGAQSIDNKGGAFARIISSNTSAGGLTFSSDFNAQELILNTEPLGSPATLYFAGNSTFTIASLSILGTQAAPVVLAPAAEATPWYLNNTSTAAVHNAQVSFSNASLGRRIWAHPGGVDGGNNVNWAFGLNAPPSLSFTGAGASDLAAAWPPSSPTGDSYTLQISTDENFTGAIVSSGTSDLSAATPLILSPNTTYYGRVNAIIYGASSTWTAAPATATLANAPAPAAVSWAYVGVTSVTVAWEAGGNPLDETLYEVQLSTASDFSAELTWGAFTQELFNSFEELDGGATYYAQVRAINHSGIPTAQTGLGGTTTIPSNSCNAVATGLWSDPGTWVNCVGPGGIPDPTDLIVINSGVVVTLDVDASVEKMTFAAASVNNGLILQNGRVLTVNGAVIMNQPSVAGRTTTWTINNATATATGAITFSGGNTSVSRVAKIVIADGALNAYGGVTFVASTAPAKVIDMSGGAGVLTIKKNLTAPANSSLLIAGTAGSAVNFADDTLSQNAVLFSSGVYNNLYFNNTSAGGAALGFVVTPANVVGNLRIQSGTLKNNGYSITGNAGRVFEVADGGVFEMNGTSVFPTGFGTLTLGTASTIRYSQTTDPLTIDSLPFGSLELMPAAAATQNFPAGSFLLPGHLSVGDGSNEAQVHADAAATTLEVAGDVTIAAHSSFSANGNKSLPVGGNWSNQGQFIANGATVAFVSIGGQTVNHAGDNFSYVVSSNTSAAGLTFSSSFTATQLLLNTADLGSSATIYFAADSTATIAALKVLGTADNPVVLGPATGGMVWYLNNTSTASVHHAHVSYSNASGGLRIWANPGGVDGGNNVNWAFGLNPPGSLDFTAADETSLTASWPAPDPYGDFYTLQVSTDPNFDGLLTSSTTAAAPSAVSPLTPNTTYYGRVLSIIYGASSTWSSVATTATWANVPASASPGWINVTLTSVTVAWDANGNPADVTSYWVDLSTSNDFIADELYSVLTSSLEATFENLNFSTTYYAQVRAINHSGLFTAPFIVGSTVTLSPSYCNAAVDGNWTTPGTWSNCTGPGGIPAADDYITINSGVNVTLNTDATVAGVTFAGATANQDLTHSGGATLIVNGPVVFNQPTANRTSAWNINAGSATVVGPITFAGTTNNASRISRITITTGELNALGDMSFTASNSASKQIVMSAGAGRLNFMGNMTIPANSCTFTGGTAGSVMNFNGSTPQILRFCTSAASAYDHVYVNNASGVTLSASVTATNVAGDVRVQSGTLLNGGHAITGNGTAVFEVADGGVFEMEGASVFPTGFGTTTLGAAGTIRYSQTTDPLDVDALNFGHLELTPAGTATQNLPAGTVVIQGNLTVGDGVNAVSASADANATILFVNGDLTIRPNATFTPNSSNPLTVGGNWVNQGTFNAGGSTVVFASSNGQTVDSQGTVFATLISSNTSASGLTFSSDFTAGAVVLNTSDLSSPATLYFAGHSTFTIASLQVNGTSGFPATLKSTIDSVAWYLNNTSTAGVSYAQVKDSNASGGLKILNDPGAVDLTGNTNWAFGVNPPADFQFTAVAENSLDLAWTAPVPPADGYVFQISPNDDFSPPVTSSTTYSLSGSTAGLSANTTYFARINSVISDHTGDWSSTLTTATLANVPATESSTWTMVGISSLTVNWNANSNPLNATRYVVEVSSDNGFAASVTQSSTTNNLNATVIGLTTAQTYYARVKAVGHSGIDTAYANLGSTSTALPNAPAGLMFTAATTSSLSANWTPPSPAGQSYTFEVSTAPDYTGVLASSNTALNDATTPSVLSVNTTYYGRVNAVIIGSSSPWSSSVTTATLANAPAAAGATWTMVGVTSVTFAWSANGNPANVTNYEAQLSTVAGFTSGTPLVKSTAALTVTFTNLDVGSTVYARVKAVNHSRIPTSFTSLGSTRTVIEPSPLNVRFTAATSASLTVAWDASMPPGDTYDVLVSSSTNFSTAASSSTSALSATPNAALLANTTYYAKVRATVDAVPYAYTAYETTSTWANTPAAAGVTWTGVHFTSVTVAWAANGNPSTVTQYTVRLSTVSGFGSGVVYTQGTTGLSGTFSGLVPTVTYYAQVKAVNHSGVSTAYANLGSTVCLTPNTPASLQVTSVQTNSLSASWSASDPAGQSYTLQTGTATNFSGTLLSSNTAGLSAVLSSGLSVNTTYYARVNSIVSGSSSAWTSSVATATLANPPATAASTWTYVGQSSVTLVWAGNGNPSAATVYRAEISDASDFSGDLFSSVTTSLQAGFDSLLTNTVYYGRVLAINHGGTETSYAALGSTQTRSPTACNAVATGNWSVAGTWSGCTGPGGRPAVTDAITINAGVTVTLNQTVAIAGLTFAAPGVNNALTHSTTNALTVNGNVTFTQPGTTGRANDWNINAGSATVVGAILFNGANTNSRISRITITTGQLNVMNGMTFQGTTATNKVIVMSGGAGTLNLQGSLTFAGNSATLTAGASSIFNYNDPVNAQTVPYFAGGGYCHLHLNNTSAGGATLAAAKTTTNGTGNLRVQSGTFSNGGFAITGGAGDIFEVANGAAFEMTGTSAFPASYTTYTFGANSTVRYRQTSTPLTLTSQTYGNLDLMPAGTATQNFPAGTFIVQGNLGIGNGTNATTVSANANATVLQVGGAVTINTGGVFIANASNALRVDGNWTNNGAFTHNSSTVSFAGSSGQTVNNNGKAFGTIISSNVSSGGLVFSSSFTAGKLYVKTSELTSAATLYFAGNSTFTVTTFHANGTPTNPVTLKSTAAFIAWYLNNTSTGAVSYVQVKDSNASPGLRILNDPGGADLTGNTNWAIGVNAPTGFQFTAAAASSLNLGWAASSPSGDSYTFQFSPNSGFSSPVTSSTTFALTGSTAGLSVNATYYARIRSTIYDHLSAWSSTISTATLANAPVTSVSTWTMVGISSLTVAWSQNGNPSGVTTYVVDVSSDNGFPGSATVSSTTKNLNATIVNLLPAQTYYARVKAVNHSGIETNYTDLGSTSTFSPNAPSGLQITTATANSLSASWTAPSPAGNSYTLHVGTASDYSGTVTASNTAATAATPSGLSVNTTYYARVNAIISGSSSAWTASITSATLANAPAAAGATWTMINVTSVTFAWDANGNPSLVTRYAAELSTDTGFANGTAQSFWTTSLSATFSSLESGATYYARVKAVNHSNVSTSYTNLGGTRTVVVPFPSNLRFTAASPTSVTAAWDASTPPGNPYDLLVSTASDFGASVSSSTTGLSASPTTPLLVNTTYYAKVRAVVGGIPYSYTAHETTSTLANAPGVAGSTWLDVSFTSVTVAWAANGNPTTVTPYTVQLSSVSGFNSGTLLSQSTTSLSWTFTGLIPTTTYYARAKAVNHSGLSTSYVNLGSTVCPTPNLPSGLQVTAAQTTALTASWQAPDPAGHSYTLHVATSSNFIGSLVSSNTAATSATTPSSLSVNTTYYLRVNSIISGSSSAWTAAVATATLANPPVTAVSTWTTVTLTTITFVWGANGNPSGTVFVAELSDAADFVSGTLYSSYTSGTSAMFLDLLTNTQYFARVKALNRSDVETSYTSLGSTQTVAPNSCNATATGNWSAAIWLNCTGVGGRPSPTDAVIINSGVTVTLNQTVTVAGLTFAAPGTNNALTHSTTNALTVNGNVTFTQPGTTGRANDWNINAGSATVIGAIVFTGANTNSRISRMTITTGQLNVMNGMTFQGTTATNKVIVMSGGAGTLNLQGNLTFAGNSATLTAGASSVFNYNDPLSAQTVRYFAGGGYCHLHLNNTSSGGVTLAAAKTTANGTGHLRVQSGTFSNGGFAITGGTGDIFEVADGAAFQMTGTAAFPGSYTTYTFAPTSTLRYAQTSSPLTLASQSYGNLELMPAGTATQNFPAGNVSIQGNLVIGNGTNATTVSANTNASALQIGGSVTINNAAVFAANAALPINVGGNWSNNGVFTHNSSTVNFGGSQAQTINNNGKAFGMIVSSNAGSGGLIFSSSFSATQLYVNTTELLSPATLYFAGNSTFTIAVLQLAGAANFPVTLKSTASSVAWFLNNSSSYNVSYLQVRDSNASPGNFIQTDLTSVNLGNTVYWDFGPPAAVVGLSAVPGIYGRTARLAWQAPGDDGFSGVLYNSSFTVQFTTDTPFAQSDSWSPSAAQPGHVYRVVIATTNVSPSALAQSVTGSLISGGTYYFRLWTLDDAGNYSPISNGATSYATPLDLSFTVSTDTIAAGQWNPGQVVVLSTFVVVKNVGNVAQTYRFSATTGTLNSPWQIGSTQDVDQFVLWMLVSAAQPGDSDFNDEDKLSDAATPCSSSVYSYSPLTCVSVPPGEERIVWFKFGAPPILSTLDPQILRFTGTATEAN